MAFFMTLEKLKIKSRIKQLRLLDVVRTCHIVQSFPAEFFIRHSFPPRYYQVYNDTESLMP